MDALFKAQAALAECAPNGRDYYPLGAGAINRASLEHAERVCKLESVREELMAILEHLLQ